MPTEAEYWAELERRIPLAVASVEQEAWGPSPPITAKGIAHRLEWRWINDMDTEYANPASGEYALAMHGWIKARGLEPVVSTKQIHAAWDKAVLQRLVNPIDRAGLALTDQFRAMVIADGLPKIRNLPKYRMAAVLGEF